MSVSVSPGDLIILDPSDKKVIAFDFDDNLAPGVTLVNSGPEFGITITVIRQNGATALTYDSATLDGTSRQVSARFLATTATRGDRYSVSAKGITNEVPDQDSEWAIEILIQDR